MNIGYNTVKMMEKQHIVNGERLFIDGVFENPHNPNLTVMWRLGNKEGYSEITYQRNNKPFITVIGNKIYI